MLVVGFGLFATLIPLGDRFDPISGYIAEVLKPKTANHTATVDSKEGMTTIKVEGFEANVP